MKSRAQVPSLSKLTTLTRQQAGFARRFVSAGLAAVLLTVTPLPFTGSASLDPHVSVASASTTLYASSPFVSKPSTRTWYRIPAVITNDKGHVFAFAERRDTDRSDMGDFEVVMRKSTDGGRTWGAIRTIADDGRNRVSNPVPVFDAATGDIVLITSIRNANDTYKGVYLQRSTDGGATFSKLLSGRIQPEGTWRGGLTGPGHGIVLQRGPHAGRIVVAMGYRRSGYYGAYCIYSDDGGKTWTTGFDRADSSGTIGYIEGTLAELPDGALHINYRDKRSSTPGRTRLHAESTDGGTSLSAGFRRSSSLLMHSVAGSALNLQGTNSDLLLFSAPTYTNPRDRSLRRDMGVFVSRDGGSTFGKPYPVELQSKPGAYSDLVQLSDGVVGILYETGTVKWRERIVFRQLSVADIRNPVKVRSTASGTLSATRVSYGSRPRVRVVVRVAGSTAPPGRILVRYSGAKKSGIVAGTFTYSNRGIKSLTLPRLPRGKYSISVTYKGNVRIASDHAKVGTLTVR